MVFSVVASTQSFSISDNEFDRIVSEINTLNEEQLLARKVNLVTEAQSLEDEQNEDVPPTPQRTAQIGQRLAEIAAELTLLEQVLAVGASAVVLDNLFGDEDKDSVAPVITLNGDNPAIVELGGTYVELGATADTGETVSVTGSVDTNTVGSYTLTYTAIDSWGNVGTTTRTVNVVDTTAPVTPVTGDNPVTVELGDSYTDAGATATDLDTVSVTVSGLSLIHI